MNVLFIVGLLYTQRVKFQEQLLHLCVQVLVYIVCTVECHLKGLKPVGSGSGGVWVCWGLGKHGGSAMVLGHDSPAQDVGHTCTGELGLMELCFLWFAWVQQGEQQAVWQPS